MNDTTKRFHRSTSEAFASERYFAVVHFRRKRDYTFIWYIVLFILVCGIGYKIISDGITALDEAEKMEQARVDSIHQAQVAARKKEALQEMCGGPESTPVDIGGGMYDCVNKRGFKQVAK